MERLQTIDEFGEINELLKIVVDATTVGLFKNLITNETSRAVPSRTLQTLRRRSGFGVNQYHLGKRWWSVFFENENNEYYNDMLSAEMFANDENNLFRYISASFYRSPLVDDRGRGAAESVFLTPPTTPYVDFYAVHNHQKDEYRNEKNRKIGERCADEGEGPYSNNYVNCKDRAYIYLKNKAQSTLDTHYSAVFDSDGDPDNAFKEGFWRNYFTRDGWVRVLLNYLYGKAEKRVIVTPALTKGRYC